MMQDTARSRLRAACEENPGRSVRELSAILGVSRARIYQLLREEQITVEKTPFIPKPVRKQPKDQWLPKTRVVVGGVECPMNETVAGTIGEMLVAADLMARGYLVFFPLIRNTRIDLIGTSPNGKRLHRIEVRCGHRTRAGTVAYNKKTNAECDHFGIVITGEPIVYIPDIPAAV